MTADLSRRNIQGMARDTRETEYPEAGRPVEGRAAAMPVSVMIEGRYVTLHPLAEAHATDLLAALLAEDQVALQRYTADEPVASLDDVLKLIRNKLATPAAAYFACADRRSGRIAGFACLMRTDLPNRVVEIGNVLYTGPLRRSRAGTEAVYLLAKYAIETLGFRRVEWKCNDHNAGSRHAALRYGFHFEGVFRQHMIVKGRNRDTAWYSLLDHEWPQRREAFEQWLAPENFDTHGRQILSLAQLNGVGGS